MVYWSKREQPVAPYATPVSNVVVRAATYGYCSACSRTDLAIKIQTNSWVVVTIGQHSMLPNTVAFNTHLENSRCCVEVEVYGLERKFIGILHLQHSHHHLAKGRRGGNGRHIDILIPQHLLASGEVISYQRRMISCRSNSVSLVYWLYMS